MSSNPYIYPRPPAADHTDSSSTSSAIPHDVPSHKRKERQVILIITLVQNLTSREHSHSDTTATSLTDPDSRQRGRRVPTHVHAILTSQIILDNQGLYDDKLKQLDQASSDSDDDDDEQPTEVEIANMTAEARASLAAEWELKQYQRAVVFRPYQRDHETYEAFKRVVGVDTLRKKVAAGGSDLKDWLSVLDAGSSDSRSHDTRKMIPVGARVANTRISRAEDKFSLEDGADQRKGRGIQNDYAGYFLSDIRYDWSKAETRQGIRAGDPRFAPSYFIQMLYPEGGGDATNVTRNFTMSPYMVAAFKAIFLSPTEARASLDHQPDDQEPARKKTKRSARAVPRRKSVAAKLNMQSVSPRNIAYTACQLRTALTDAHDWSTVYDGFNYLFFYDFIVDFFEGPQKTEERRQNAKSILEWWNEQVFQEGQFRRSDGTDMVSQSLALLDEL
ncbi:hypothetical protein FB107DRAFT_270654 [Schizophyllum commune]